MEAVIFIGIQASGKSTFYRERFFDTHVRLNLDMLRTRRREWILLTACLEAKQRFVVDNTNVLAEERMRYIKPAQLAGFRVVGYFFEPEAKACCARNEQRRGAARIPPAALFGKLKCLERPQLAEGFSELYRVRIADPGQFIVEPWSGE